MVDQPRGTNDDEAFQKQLLSPAFAMHTSSRLSLTGHNSDVLVRCGEDFRFFCFHFSFPASKLMNSIEFSQSGSRQSFATSGGHSTGR